MVFVLQRSSGSSASKKSSVPRTQANRIKPLVDFNKTVTLSAVPLINEWLTRFELGPHLRAVISQAGLSWTVSTALFSSLVAAMIPAYLVYQRTSQAILSIVIGLVAGCIPTVIILFKRSKRFKAFGEGLPEALDLLVNALRVGHSVNSSLGMIAKESSEPIAGELRLCFEEQNYGLELEAAMENLMTRVPLTDLRMVVTAILIQKQSGGNLAEVLEKAAVVLRERLRLVRQVQVLTAQGRLTGWVLSALPIFLGVALYLVNPKMMSVLWTHPNGIIAMWVAGGMIVVGTILIQKIVRVDV